MGEREQYTLPELAAAAGMTARNVRAYQTRRLLPPPDRHGRTAVYGARHLLRLQQIATLRAARIPLRLIRQAVENGESLDGDGLLVRWNPPPEVIDLGRVPSTRAWVSDQVACRAEAAVPGTLDRLAALGCYDAATRTADPDAAAALNRLATLAQRLALTEQPAGLADPAPT